MEKEAPINKKDLQAKESIRMAYNENPYGASPLAKKAYLDNVHLISQYPPLDGKDIKNRIAKLTSLQSDNICVGAGSVCFIDILLKNFINPEENIIIPEISFAAYTLLCNRYQVQTRKAEMKDYGIDLDAIIQRIDEKTRLVFLANPNNPTGTILSHDDLYSFIKKIDSKIYVVIDEAYVEYVKDKNFPRSLEFISEFENIIVLRSFSKAFALAGLRIGYAISNKTIISRLENYIVPFSITKMASEAVISALSDLDFLAQSVEKNAEERRWLSENLTRLGFNVIPSEGNFLFLHFQDSDERNEIHDKLLENAGISTRKTDLFGDVNSLRITVGNHEDNEKLIFSIDDQYHRL